MKTKNLFRLCVAALAMVAFAACSSNGPDARDAFVGKYSYEATGSIDFQIVKVPLDEKGTLTISKKGDKDQVIITGYNDTINATVAGNVMTLENATYSETIQGVNCVMNFEYDKASLTDNVLRWTSKINATGQYSVMQAQGTGTVSVVATKIK